MTSWMVLPFNMFTLLFFNLLVLLQKHVSIEERRVHIDNNNPCLLT